MPPNLLPMVSTFRPSTAQATVAASRATMEPGTRLVTRGQRRMMASDATATPVAVEIDRPNACPERPEPARELAGHVLDRQAEEVFDLRGGDQHGDAVGETDGDRPRDEADGRPQAGRPP